MDNSVEYKVKKELVKFKARVLRLECKAGDIDRDEYIKHMNIIYDQVTESIHDIYKHSVIGKIRV